MGFNNYFVLSLLAKGDSYLKKNLERFSDAEKGNFRAYLLEVASMMANGLEEPYVPEVHDFLISEGIIEGENRHQLFADYLNEKYDNASILDVGAGRMCRLSTLLGENGHIVTSMDPNIRVSNMHKNGRKIHRIDKSFFESDAHSKTDKGTDILGYDLIVSEEPGFDLASTIIEQCEKYGKPFEISFGETRWSESSEGRLYAETKKYFDHLERLHDNVYVNKANGLYVATNTEPIIGRELEY